MKLPPNSIHPEGESKSPVETTNTCPFEVDTFDGKVRVEWDPSASVTPLGQLPFFIQFLKIGQRFSPWISDCPLSYLSNNAPQKVDVLGSLFLSVLSGHTRYSHITTLMSDDVNAQLLGMKKFVSDDSARRALKKIDEEEGIEWLQKHLLSTCEPLLNTPWILDVDTTIKTIYGKQQGAEVGYNPKKPGRPSHTYHTYMIANLRLVLEVEVQAGNQSQSSYSLPGLLKLLDKLPKESRPYLVRGDCDWGTDKIMQELETRKQGYLFKLKKSKFVKELIYKHHCLGEWTYFKDGWEAKEAEIKLNSWDATRRAIIVRQRVLSKNDILALEHKEQGQLQLSFLDGPEDMRAFKYSVLVTNIDDDIISLVQHYRDRADCENNFDEIKNQWGWGGYTTKDLKSCQFMARIIALVYNWWTLFVRLANPDSHLEAITSRPLLLSSVGRMIKSGRQQKMLLTSQHGKTKKVQSACRRVMEFFKALKMIAPQLSGQECWRRILAKIMERFRCRKATKRQILLLETN